MIKIKESQEQAYLFNWAHWKQNEIPELKWMFSVPNGGGKLNPVTARRLKATGLKPGVPDIFLPVARGGYHGLFIELKAVGGKPSEFQLAYIQYLNDAGYYSVVIEGWIPAKELIESYLEGKICRAQNKST